MPQRRDPFGVALGEIRRQLTAGRWAPGSSISITELATELRLSPTPVREALAHLAGEGLVEEHRGQGYSSPQLDAQRLVELYALHHLYLCGALACPWRGAPAAAPKADADDEGAFAERAWTLFTALVTLAENETLAVAHRRVAERLVPVWRVEARIGIPDLEIVDAMARQLIDADRAALEASLARYFEVRRCWSGDLVKALRAPPGRPDIFRI